MHLSIYADKQPLQQIAWAFKTAPASPDMREVPQKRHNSGCIHRRIDDRQTTVKRKLLKSTI
ncbi:hypothetical protein KSB_81040 [Ktedonobacter robiniae]|uniref:Uncharacterized protein n=1 Tax=Ktedonobacter robiniae TaxID=2778365 RepID=A0ABQ3V386_9CHLR|nr:hypothetical protein KSB_81040 [Ktedonobacter robiniae]